MKLADLKPKFLKIVHASVWRITTLEDCDGIQFLCPKCFVANYGPMGTHSVICWKPHVSQTIPPISGRWNFEGTSVDNLSLKAGSSSVLLNSGCQAQFFVKNGMIEAA